MKLQSITKSLALATVFALPSMAQAEDVSLDEVRAIAKEAYIYGYPMVDSYRIEYGTSSTRPAPNTRDRGM